MKNDNNRICNYSCSKKGKNSYTISVSYGYDIHGKQIRKSKIYHDDPKLTKKQNQRARDEFAYDLLELLKSELTYCGSAMKFSTYANMWLKKYAKIEVDVTTYETYEREVTNKFIPAFGDLYLTKITPLHIRDYFITLMENGYFRGGRRNDYQFNSIKRWYNILCKMFRVAMEWQLIEKNPCDGYRPKNPKNKNDDTIKFLTSDEAQIFLHALSTPYSVFYKERLATRGEKVVSLKSYETSQTLSLQFQILFQLALSGGFRRGEILALTWDKIDFDNNEININCSTAIVDHKQILKTTKTRSSIRKVVMPPTFMTLLKLYKKEQMELRILMGDAWATNEDGTPCNFLFIQSTGEQMCLSTPNSKLKKFIKHYNATVKSDELKLPPITFHALRHTSATILLGDSPADSKTVSTRLGHSNTTTTLNIYYHACKKKDEIAADFMEDFIRTVK